MKTRTYEVVLMTSGYYRIRSNGKLLAQYYSSAEHARFDIQDLVRRVQARARQKAYLAEIGVEQRPRDSKRSKAYKAERQAGMMLGGAWGVTAQQAAKQLQRWAVLAGFVNPCLPDIEVSARLHGGSCHGRRIKVNRRASLGTYVHEYAHTLTWDEWPAHGPRWAAAYVRLARAAMGDEQANKLAREFRCIGFPV